MKTITKIFLFLGFILAFFSIFYAEWWNANEPYCCNHNCGQTIDNTTCTPGIFLIALIIATICCISGGILFEFKY